jgi:hypothetical protein
MNQEIAMDEMDMVASGDAWPKAAVLAADFIGVRTYYTGLIVAEDDGYQEYDAAGRPACHMNCRWWEDDLLPADLRGLLADLRRERQEEGHRRAVAGKVRPGRGPATDYVTVTGAAAIRESLSDRIERRLRELWPDLCMGPAVTAG